MPPKKRSVSRRSQSRRSTVTKSQSEDDAAHLSNEAQHQQLAQSQQTQTSTNQGKTTTKTVVTETIVRQSVAGGSNSLSPGQQSKFVNEFEEWDLKPKTDYTYARSPSYSSRFIGQQWVMPNMSRPRLRGGAPVDISPQSSVSRSSVTELMSVSQTDNRHRERAGDLVQSAPRRSESRNVLQESYLNQPSTSSRRRTRTYKTNEKDMYEEDVTVYRTLSDSVTRSGRRGNLDRAARQESHTSLAQHDGRTDVTDLSMDEYMRIEKQLEYSGVAGPHKESSRLSLYGLDHDYVEEDDLSDTDSALPLVEASDTSPVSLATYTRLLINTLLTVITTILHASWHVVSAPVYWAASLGSSQSDDKSNLGYYQTTTHTTTNGEESSKQHHTIDEARIQTTTSAEVTSLRESKSADIAKFSDDEDEMTGRRRSGRRVTRSTSKYRPDDTGVTDDDEDDALDTSVCSSCCFYAIAVAYLLFIALPVGIVKGLRRSVSWLYCSLLLPAVDGAKSTLQSGYSLFTQDKSSVASESTSTATSYTTTTTTAATTATTTTSMAVSEISYTSSLLSYLNNSVFGGLYRSATYVTNSVFGSLYRSATYVTNSVFGGLYRSATYVTNSVFGGLYRSATYVTDTMFGGLFRGAGWYGSRLVSAGYWFSEKLLLLLLMPVVAATSGGAVCCNWCWRLGGWLHQIIAKVVLVDVWLLSRVGERRSGACCCLFPLLLLLLLLPLLLYPGSQYFFVPLKEESSASVTEQTYVNVPAAANPGDHLALRELIEKELSTAKADLKTHDTALYKENLVYIQRLETQLDRLRTDVTQLETAQLALIAQLKGCCKNDTTLAALVKSGVHEHMAAIMLGGGSGSAGGSEGSVRGDSNTGAFGSTGDASNSNSAFVMWLNSQFAKPGDFDAKIAALTEELNKGLREQAEATRAAALAAAQAERVAKGAAGDAGKVAGLAASLQTAQGDQSATWIQEKDKLHSSLAAIVSELKAKDDLLTTEVAAAAALAAAAAATAASRPEDYKTEAPESDGVAAGAGLGAGVGEDTSAGAGVGTGAGAGDDTSAGGAGVGIGVGTGCGCDSRTMVLPDTYQSITEDQVKLLIREALVIFGADKTGMVDYALESAGGSVISTRCSETYHKRTAQLSLFGIPLWYTSNSPRTVIQPEVHPGQCWAFRGSQGYIVIQLAGWVKPTAFSMEHIPKVLSPSGLIDSAPKDFSVWGLQHDRDIEGTLLGNYTYLDNNEPLQFFPVTNSGVDAFHIVELRILSNHGNQEYTCLYRFRVHGVMKRS